MNTLLEKEENAKASRFTLNATRALFKYIQSKVEVISTLRVLLWLRR